ncbi:MAG: TonB-dependent receptor [Paraglaciecola sp.]|uniref:TonB-dependent receptor n=1 Tax=Paraglaciecola sp. TaxID=1920173 RepID=UPI00329A7A9D
MNIKTYFSVAACTLPMAMSVSAQEVESPDSPDNAEFETIIVTAQRRDQALQDVPLAISAFNKGSIERGDLDSVGKLEGQVPGLVVSTTNTRSNISIRGIGSGLATAAAESGVPVNVDGVYMTRTTLQGTVFADLQQIEVLRGPQGTLYGRNATGGTINIWTKQPDDELSGEVSTLQGNAGRKRVRGVFSTPISETLSARFGLEFDENDGHVKNITLDEMADPEEHKSARAVFNWMATDELDVVFRVNVSEDEVGAMFNQYLSTQGAIVNPISDIAPNPPFLPAGYTAGQSSDDKLNIRNDQRSRLSFEDKVFSLTASYDMDWAVLKSVTAYQEHVTLGISDNDGTSGAYATQSVDDDSEAWTQEFTLSGDDDNLDWVVGTWYLDDTLEAKQEITLIGFFPDLGPAQAAPVFNYNQETESLAVFGQATYHVSDSLRLTAGLRYTDEEKTVYQTVAGFGAPAEGTDNLSYTEVSPKASIDYNLNDDMMIYASVSKGFKAGGVNVNQIGQIYDPETLLSYETGLKSDWLEGHFQANVNAYYYDFEGFQANSIVGISSVTTNAADAEVTGLEFEFRLIPMDGLTLKTNVAWADSEFGEYFAPNTFGPTGVTNLEGNRLPSQAEYSGNISALYELSVGDGLVTLSFDHAFSSSYYLDIDNSDYAEQGSYGKTNIRASYLFEAGSLEGLELSLFANNLEDDLQLTKVKAGNILAGVMAEYSDPRTFGAELRYRF